MKILQIATRIAGVLDVVHETSLVIGKLDVDTIYVQMQNAKVNAHKIDTNAGDNDDLHKLTLLRQNSLHVHVVWLTFTQIKNLLKFRPFKVQKNCYKFISVTVTNVRLLDTF
jgi:hypothetical protein